MPTNKDFKRLVRQRAAATGEPYTAAGAALVSAAPAGPPLRPREDTDLPSRWVALLGDLDHALGAHQLLKALPADLLRPAVVRGLGDSNWRVRRSCCRLLDDLSFTDESLVGLQRCLDDDHPKVRRAALHSLACDHCKPDGCAVDFRPLFERMLGDPSRAVRAMIVGPLTWKYTDDWAVRMLRRVAADDPSAQLRDAAVKGLERIERQLASDEARRALPDELRAKTERHRGKWVAIADGRIIGVSGHGGSLRRIIKGTPHAGDATVYWVGPDEA